MNWLLYQIPVFEKIDLYFWIFMAVWLVALIFDSNWKYAVMNKELLAAIGFYLGFAAFGLVLFAATWNLIKAYPPFRPIDIVFWILSLFITVLFVLFVVMAIIDSEKDETTLVRILRIVILSFAIVPMALGVWFFIWLSIKFFFGAWILTFYIVAAFLVIRKIKFGV